MAAATRSSCGIGHRSTSARRVQTHAASFGGLLQRLFSPSPSPARRKQKPAEVEELLQLAAEDKRGLKLTNKPRIMELVDKLAELQEGSPALTDPQLLSATWKLAWTTEKETLWIVQNAKLFGTQAGDVYQVISLTDEEDSRLQNVIEFPPEGAFIVNSSVAQDEERPQRTNFKFTSAKLNLPEGRALKLPPFGKGWFEQVYIDDEVRVAKDIRGDTLVVVRDGPARIFE